MAWALALFFVTSLPGDNMGAGISFGLADTISNIIAGFVLKYFKDTHALLGCVTLSIIP
jgi:hypothetical protein